MDKSKKLRLNNVFRSRRDELFTNMRSIFSTGRNGYLHRFTTTELNQTSTGTTPVTAVTDPVGFVADTRLGMALGPDLISAAGATNTFDGTGNITGWSTFGGGINNNGVDYADITTGGASNIAIARTITTTPGKTYQITFDRIAGATASSIYLDGVSIGIAFSATAGSYTAVFVATAASHGIYVVSGGAGLRVRVDNIYVKLLDGNHAIQATAPARPTWQVDAGGKYYLSVLGTDDSLTSATGGGGTLGFFWCGVIQFTGGAGTLQTIFADNGANTGYKVQKDVNNKLSFSAGNGVAFTTLVSTAALADATKYLLTVRDNGTNLSVQINSAAAETVARPVVTAGTAGYTLFKDNGAASSYLIANFYPDVYYKDTGGTDAEISAAQDYCRMMAGMI